MVQAPPTRARLSSTSTRLPALARYAAQARPLWPAPTITTSQRHEANSRMGAGNPISPRTAAVGEITAVVSTVERRVGKRTITTQMNPVVWLTLLASIADSCQIIEFLCWIADASRIKGNPETAFSE